MTRCMQVTRSPRLTTSFLSDISDGESVYSEADVEEDLARTPVNANSLSADLSSSGFLTDSSGSILGLDARTYDSETEDDEAVNCTDQTVDATDPLQ